MVDDIVTKHHVERGIVQRQRFALCGNRFRLVLPGGEQVAIMIGKRVDPYLLPRLEEEMSPCAPDPTSSARTSAGIGLTCSSFERTSLE